MPPTILTLLDYYLPGHKAGGPVRSVEQLAAQLGEELRFHVVTRDRDLGDAAPYPGVQPGRWQRVGNAQVLYLSPRGRLGAIRRLLARTPHDAVYLNSLFSPAFAAYPLLLRRLGAVPRRPWLLAPRGELHPGALRTGTWRGLLPRAAAARLPPPRQVKKAAYLRAARGTGVLGGIAWQASTAHERGEILAAVGEGARVWTAPDLVPPPPAGPPPPRQKEPGELRVVFVSRIAAKKNLLGAIRMLAGVRGRVAFHIHGPVDDAAYWAECQAALAHLPPSVRARYHGPLQHHAVGGVFAAAHLLLLPTFGENFGHVIVEALREGCPVLISDQTPWRGLEARRAGWDLPLADPEAFTAALQRCVQMDGAAFARWSAGAAALARDWSGAGWPLARNREMFMGVLSGAAPGAPSLSALPSG